MRPGLASAELEPFKGGVRFKHEAKALANGELKYKHSQVLDGEEARFKC